MQSVYTTGANALLRQERRLALVANNLSNAHTVGFKKETPSFKEILQETLTGQVEKVLREEAQIDFRQGELQITNNDLDLAIEGEGFFKVKTPQGLRYTRNGHFRLDKDYRLIQASGFPILGKRGEIFLKGGKITIEANGIIKVDNQEVDQIALVTFADLKSLAKEGHHLFKLSSPQEEKEAGEAVLHQGYVESANVNVVEEMIALIDAQRSFEAYTRLLQANDELDAKAVNELGKV